jgi:hypothetical protein
MTGGGRGSRKKYSGIIYYYKVRAVAEKGNSDFSNTVAGERQEISPVGLVCSARRCHHEELFKKRIH